MTGRNTAKGPAAIRRRVLLAANLVGLAVLMFALWPAPRWAPQPGTVDQMVREIAGRHAHGYPENVYPSVEEMSERAVGGSIVTTCGPVSYWTVALLADKGITARMVQTITTLPLNGWADGHVFVEVWMDRWVAYDVDRKFQPTTKDGQPLSADEWLARVSSGDYAIRPLLYPLNDDAIRAEDRRWLQVRI